MELSELRSFLLIAELGSFSRAATRSGVPQPTLSRQINRLETEFGGALYYRHGRGIALTDIGMRLFESVKPIVGALDRVRDEIIEEASQPSGLIRLGVPPSFGRTIAASVISSFREQCPLARLHLMEAFSSTLAEWVEAGSVDAAVLYDVRRSPNMIVTPIFEEELFFIESARDSLSTDPVAIAAIDTRQLLLTGKGQGLRRAVEMGFDEAGIKIASSMEIDSIAAIKQLVAAGGFTTILPYGAAYREISDGDLVPRSIIAPHRMTARLVIATALSKPITRAMRQVIAILKQEVAHYISKGLLRGIVQDDC